jgi:hypothetical protein
MQFVHVVTLAIVLASAPSMIGLAWAASVPEARQRRTGARHDDDVVLQWNEVALEAAWRSTFGPPMVARALAILHTCAYDAWAAYDRVARGTRLGGTLRQPWREQNERNKREAISVSAYRALVDLRRNGRCST